jgi:chromosome segregation ATPase
MKKKEKDEDEQIAADSEIVPVKKRELLARLKGDESKYKACYEDCVKYAVAAKAMKDEVEDYQKILEENRSKFNNLKDENGSLKNENVQLKGTLGIYKSKTGEVQKEIENHSYQYKDVQKEADERYLKEKDNIEKEKMSRRQRYRFE